MELAQESDAEALWQDTMDLLAGRALPESVLAMLRNCTPTKIEDQTLYLVTPMRMVAKTVGRHAAVVEECMSTAAFEPMRLSVAFEPGAGTVPLTPAPQPLAQPAATAAAQAPAAQAPATNPAAPQPAAVPAPQPAAAPQARTVTGSSSMTREEADRWLAATSAPAAHPAGPTRAADQDVPRRIAEDTWDAAAQEAAHKAQKARRRAANPLVDDISDATSKLTFERFVRGDENDIAYQAALQVANGMNTTYNPLFIYGKSGLGKTHLLRAVQNYIAKNDPTRLCVYRDASSFITDYTEAMRDHSRSAASVLRQNYADIDVLIIDDVQKLAGKAGTVAFFFDTFNDLIANGKQIVLAADRTPAQLGMGKDGFDERVTSRLGAGFTAPVQVPSYELKVRLIETFCDRMREDAERENVAALSGRVSPAACQYMAERAGTNIRLIEGFCQRCLFAATAAEARGRDLERAEIDSLARECWPTNRRDVSIEDVQQAVERFYDIDHETLVGNKRNKGVMEARHVAIWLSRELCDLTLADIGKYFGGRSHATIMHSINVIEDAKKDDKTFFDRLVQIQEAIANNA